MFAGSYPPLPTTSATRGAASAAAPARANHSTIPAASTTDAATALHGHSPDTSALVDSRLRGNDGSCRNHDDIDGFIPASAGNDGNGRRTRANTPDVPCATAGAGSLTVDGFLVPAGATDAATLFTVRTPVMALSLPLSTLAHAPEFGRACTHDSGPSIIWEPPNRLHEMQHKPNLICHEGDDSVPGHETIVVDIDLEYLRKIRSRRDFPPDQRNERIPDTARSRRRQ